MAGGTFGIGVCGLSMSVKIGTGFRTIPAGCLTDSIAVGRWPVRGVHGRIGRIRGKQESWVGQ